MRYFDNDQTYRAQRHMGARVEIDGDYIRPSNWGSVPLSGPSGDIRPKKYF